MLYEVITACPGGCVNGPLAGKNVPSALRRVRLLEYAEAAPERDKPAGDRSEPDLAGVLPDRAGEARPHEEEEIRTALRSVGKYTVKDELNCGSCGYDTCRSYNFV